MSGIRIRGIRGARCLVQAQKIAMHIQTSSTMNTQVIQNNRRIARIVNEMMAPMGRNRKSLTQA
jgi:hypothetical protein